MGEQEVIDSQRVVISNLRQSLNAADTIIAVNERQKQILADAYLSCKNDFEFVLFATFVFVFVVLFMLITSIYFDQIIDFFTLLKNKIKSIWTNE